MISEILNTLDELKQKLYHNIEQCVVEKGQHIDFAGYQTDITNIRLNVHGIFIGLDDNNEQTVYVKYNMVGDDEEFGRRIMFRNSYDKSMSFAFLEGLCCWICSNGAIKSDEMQFKRVHKETAFDDAMLSIDCGFNRIDVEFNNIKEDMSAFKECHVDKELMYDLIGNLFFEQGVLSSVQLNIVKDQLNNSDKFKHLLDPEFSAYDMYNHITESLKRSHPLTYVDDHIKTHKLFESTFIKTVEPVEIITPETALI